MQIFALAANDEFFIGDDIRGKVLQVGANFVDLELESLDDGDTRVVRLTQNGVAFENEEAEELAGELAVAH